MMLEQDSEDGRVVLAFGAFDPLHAGHRDFFRQAGGKLTVVVARDSYISEVKKREPKVGEQERLAAVLKNEHVHEAILGAQWPTADQYGLLDELDFDVLALGYDQRPTDDEVREELERRGKGWVEVVRLKAFLSEKYKSSRYV